MSAYGGIVAFNRNADGSHGQGMRGVLLPRRDRPGLRARGPGGAEEAQTGPGAPRRAACGPAEGFDVRKVSGGAMLQAVDDIPVDTSSWETRSKREPTESELRDLAFAWKAAKHVRSNSIVLAKTWLSWAWAPGSPTGSPACTWPCGSPAKGSRGSVLASDAYFPFADGVELAAKGGVTAVAEPGGSLRDDEVIEAADRLRLALVFTGSRHFKH